MYNNISKKLKQHKFWCVWKDKKIPYNPKTNQFAKSTDPSTFSDFETAYNAFKNSGCNYTGLGIGIFDGISAIDIDHCVVDGKPSEMATDIINKMNSYTEISPSGTGIRIIFKVTDFDYDKDQYYIHNQNRHLEIYVSGCTNKYVTITGNTLLNFPIADCTSILPQVLDKYMRRNITPTVAKPTPPAKHTNSNSYTSTRTDKDYFEIGLSKDKKLKEYYYGSRPLKSESENDLGFMSKLLYWTNRNEDLAVQIFLSSPYYDQKDDKHKKKLERRDYIMSLLKTGMPTNTAREDDLKYRESHPIKNNTGNTSTPQVIEIKKPTPKKLNIISAQDLQQLDLPPIKYLVEDILPEGTSILSASPKMGKSWFVLDMGLKIASGKTFMNKKTEKVGVLYLALEDGYKRLQDRMNKVLECRQAPELFHFATEAPTLDENLLDVLEDYIKDYPDIKLIIIDTLQKIRSKSTSKGSMYQNDYSEVGTLKTFMDKHSLSLLFVHHNRKMKDPENNFNMISGTNAIMGAADTIFMIDKKSREDKNATLSITGRDVEESNTVIHFNQQTFKWEVVGDASEIAEQEKRENYNNDPVVQTIKTLLNESPNHQWEGMATALLNEGKRITQMHIASSAKDLGKRINDIDFDASLCQYDSIMHQTINNGNASKKHRYYFLPSKINICEFDESLTENSSFELDEEDDDGVEF